MTRYSKNLEGPRPPSPLATPMHVRFIWRIRDVNTVRKNVRNGIRLGPYFYIKTCLLEVSFIVKYTHTDSTNSAK